MINKYNEMAEAVIAEAKAVLASGKQAGGSVDTSKMSSVGKAIIGQVNNFSFSPEIRATSILREGYSKFTAIVAELARKGSDPFTAGSDAQLASAAQDLIGNASEDMGLDF